MQPVEGAAHHAAVTDPGSIDEDHRIDQCPVVGHVDEAFGHDVIGRDTAAALACRIDGAVKHQGHRLERDVGIGLDDLGELLHIAARGGDATVVGLPDLAKHHHGDNADGHARDQ